MSAMSSSRPSHDFESSNSRKAEAKTRNQSQHSTSSNKSNRSVSRHLLWTWREAARPWRSATADLMDDLSFSQPRSTYLDRQLEVTTHIANSIKSITVQTTIDDIVDQVCREYQVDMSTGKRHANVIRHLIFAAVGWSTMLYTATYKAEDADFTTTETTIEGSSTVSSAKQHVAHSSKRPIGAVLRNLGLIPIACPPRPGSSQGLPSLLAVTHLNFFSLARLGDVKITWTDDLAKHCDFDRYGRKKELKLFRLPSFCASICLSESNETLLGRLFKSHTCQHNCQSAPETVAKAYMLEVLLSYRLLFGQHHRSRRLFRDQEHDKAKWNGTIDPLLDALCGAKDMSDFNSTKELLCERGVYNAYTNFPHLRARLMELEDYSASQRPRNLIEVWNDERDPERLLTFKAVLIVGGMSIFLSLVQVLIGIAQVAVAVWY